jgi:HlyD family secretion protein
MDVLTPIQLLTISLNSNDHRIDWTRNSMQLNSKKRFRTSWILACVAVAGIVFVSGCSPWFGNKQKEASAAAKTNSGSDESVNVEVTTPRKGGLARKTVQPASVYAFEGADLYAQANGYLQDQKVDIGSRVKKGELLARIDVPEAEQEVLERNAAVEQAKAAVEQMNAKVDVATAELEASQSAVDRQIAAQKRDESRRSFHEKAFKRVKSLLELKSIDERIVDEKEDQYIASESAVDATMAAVVTARVDVKAAAARVGQARADKLAAEAAEKLAKAALTKAEVRLKFGDINSPYDGVVTARNFLVGDFIHDAQNGSGGKPLLRVERTDLMRIVAQIPDREVPYIEVGNLAEVRIDALGDRIFQGNVSRVADSEDQSTRTMQTEIDIVNKEKLLRNGMYGRVTIILKEQTDGWTVPSTAIVGKVENGKGQIYIVKDGKSHLLQVDVGEDTGIEVEILKGLTAESQVVTRYNGAIGDKVNVRATPAKAISK